jgi:hypothetical protein
MSEKTSRTSSVHVSNYRCEQIFGLLKNVESGTGTRLADTNTWRDAHETEGQQSQLISEDYAGQTSVIYLTNDWVC